MALIASNKINVYSQFIPSEHKNGPELCLSVFDDCGEVNLSLVLQNDMHEDLVSIYVEGKSEIKQLINFLQLALTEIEDNE